MFIMSIENNLENIRARISAACERSGRDPSDVTLIAVTKTRTVDEINEAVSLGLTELGENRVQELLEKYDKVCGDVHWHLIGHLQRNKVKYIADKVCMIHSVDTVPLAAEIDRQCAKHGRVMNILAEVNISGEESKSGMTAAEVYDFMDQVSAMPHVKVCGLMTMAPKFAQNDEIRRIFAQLSQLAVDISAKKYDNISMDKLSMGMSSDFETAIEEGSHMVRIGTALFK